jgi:hypothetical protein
MNQTKPIQKKKLSSNLLVIIFSILITTSIVYLLVQAGTLNNASSPAPTFYTLTDIYTRLTTNATATAEDHNLGPSASPDSTFYTLTQIYEAIPTIDASKVVYGTSYLGVAGTATTTVSTLCYDNPNYYKAIANCDENDPCDSVFNGTYTADGIVVNEGTCETGDVCFNDPHYYSNMSSCDNNDPCDSDVAPTYIADGLVCSAVCVVDGSVADDGACCHNDNCESGDCTDNVCVGASAVCGNGIVEDGEDCECGVGGFGGDIGDTSGCYHPVYPNPECRNCELFFDMCFTPTTQVLLANGTSKDIKDIQAGDQVISYDIFTDQQVVGEVSELQETKGNIGYYIINNTLEVTSNHPIFVNGKWSKIIDLKIGDTLKDSKGNDIAVTSIQKGYKTNKTYNLIVKEYANFYAEGYLVGSILK